MIVCLWCLPSLFAGKRVAETMCLAYKDEGTVDVRIVRIFNTFGPRMHPNDGRVVSNFIMQVWTVTACNNSTSNP